MIHEFYAVTLSSVYRVVDEDPLEYNKPTAQKVGIRTLTGMRLGTKIKGGSLFAIGRKLVSYEPNPGTPPERRLELLPQHSSLMISSSIVALFSERKGADECVRNPHSLAYDPRWRKETEQVLSDIGLDHPHFYLCYDPHIGIIRQAPYLPSL